MIELRIIDRSPRQIFLSSVLPIFSVLVCLLGQNKLSLRKSDERRMARATGFIHRLHTECYFCCTFPAGCRVIRSIA